MPVYQRAKPFDIVRKINELQVAVKAIQLRSPSQGTAWQQVALANGWTGTLNVKIGIDGRLQISADNLVPGTISSGILLATLTGEFVPNGNHGISVVVDDMAAATSGNPRMGIHTDGTMNLFGIGSTTTGLFIEATIPLDI